MKERTTAELLEEINELQHQLTEANDTIEAIRTGQVDALVLQGKNGHEVYTLKTADHAYRVFIEKMIEGAVTLDEDGVILFANSRFAQMVGKELYSVVGKLFHDYVPEDFKQQFTAIFKSSWSEDHKAEIVLTAGKSTVPVQLSLTALELGDKHALSVFITDLTLQKNNQKQLENNNQKLSELNHQLELSNNDLMQFASVASHDLQEPLRKIQVFSSILKSKGNGITDTEQGLYIDKIIASAGRMRALIIDVLNYSKLSAIDQAFEAIDLNAVIKEILEDFELPIAERTATFHVGVLPKVKGVRGLVRQVFQNIISNALKFSKSDVPPVIEISGETVGSKAFNSPSENDGPCCVVRIKDNGIGFDEKYHKNIFALFERLNTKDSYEGTGIGMAVAKKIMEKHNGLITARSKPGHGAEFMLLFDTCTS